MANEILNSGKQILDENGNGIVDTFEEEFSQTQGTDSAGLGWGQEYTRSIADESAYANSSPSNFEEESQYQETGNDVGRVIPFRKPESLPRLDNERIQLAEEAMAGLAFKEFADARLTWQKNVIERIASQAIDINGFREQARAALSNAA